MLYYRADLLPEDWQENWDEDQNGVPDMVENWNDLYAYSKERKKKIIIQIYVLMGISIFFAPILWVKIGLFCLTVFITYYLFKVIPDKD